MTDIAWELAVQLEVYRPCLVFRLVFGSSSGLPCSHVENGELFGRRPCLFYPCDHPGDNSESASQVNIASFSLQDTVPTWQGPTRRTLQNAVV